MEKEKLRLNQVRVGRTVRVVRVHGEGALRQRILDMGNINKAIELVMEAAEMANNIAVTPACLRDAAAMYEAQGNKAEALKLYNRINDEYPSSPVAYEANIKINAAK